MNTHLIKTAYIIRTSNNSCAILHRDTFTQELRSIAIEVSDPHPLFSANYYHTVTLGIKYYFMPTIMDL